MQAGRVYDRLIFRVMFQAGGVRGFLLLVLLGWGLLLVPTASGQDPTAESNVYDSTSVSFKSGPYTLSGRLLAPRNRQGKLPALVFCVGSGQSSTLARYAPFLSSLFTQNLSMDSLVLLFFDKRGVGGSEGEWYRADFEARAADAKAAADYLSALDFVDSRRIAVAGHSQGGWITQVCLANYPDTFAGGISLAGPVFSVREQLRNDYASAYICQKQMPEEKAWQKARRKVRFQLAVLSVLPIKKNWKQLKLIRNFTPAPYLNSLQKPLLLLFAENDALVSPARCLAELHRLFPDGLPPHIQTATIPDATHSFKLADFCYRGSTQSLPYSEVCRSEIRDWVRTHLLH